MLLMEGKLLFFKYASHVVHLCISTVSGTFSVRGTLKEKHRKTNIKCESIEGFEKKNII